jgi:hypothetical protein
MPENNLNSVKVLRWLKACVLQLAPGLPIAPGIPHPDAEVPLCAE